MKPIFSIISALLITLLPFFVLYDTRITFQIHTISLIFLFIIFMIVGGGISTWFSNENKIIYSVYYGIISLVIVGIILKLFFGDSYYICFLAPIFAGFAGVIAKNEKGSIKNLLKNKFRMDYKDFLVKLYKRNKISLFISLAIFLASVIIGSVGPFLSSPFHEYMLNMTITYFTNIKGVSPTTFSIFLNNGTLAFLYLYVGGFGFGIINTLELIKIGLLTSFISVEYPISIIYTLPHGIFELTGYVIATAAGYNLLSIAINILKDFTKMENTFPINEQINRILDYNYTRFKDSVILIMIAIFILFIAAIIEANITVPLANYILSLTH